MKRIQLGQWHRFFFLFWNSYKLICLLCSINKAPVSLLLFTRNNSDKNQLNIYHRLIMCIYAKYLFTQWKCVISGCVCLSTEAKLSFITYINKERERGNRIDEGHDIQRRGERENIKPSSCYVVYLLFRKWCPSSKWRVQWKFAFISFSFYKYLHMVSWKGKKTKRKKKEERT